MEAETKKQERLHMAMATGVLWVKFDRDSSTQSRTIEDWPVAWSVWNTWERENQRENATEGDHRSKTNRQQIMNHLHSGQTQVGFK